MVAEGGGVQDVSPCRARSCVALGGVGRSSLPARRWEASGHPLLCRPVAAWARVWITKQGALKLHGSPCFGINRQVMPVLLSAT